jgi:hypothetical protein
MARLVASAQPCSPHLRKEKQKSPITLRSIWVWKMEFHFLGHNGSAMIVRGFRNDRYTSKHLLYHGWKWHGRKPHCPNIWIKKKWHMNVWWCIVLMIIYLKPRGCAFAVDCLISYQFFYSLGIHCASRWTGAWRYILKIEVLAESYYVAKRSSRKLNFLKSLRMCGLPCT